MRADLSALDDEIDGLIEEVQRRQSSSKLAPAGEIQAQVRDLFERLETIRTKATSSEKTVKEITGDIRSLDTAKNNLVASMTMLRRLQMLGECRRAARPADSVHPLTSFILLTPKQNLERRSCRL